MTVVGVTGAEGFFGWHLRCRLHALHPEFEIRAATRGTFSTDGAMDCFVSGCDAIVHLAGVNRGDEDTVAKANPAIAQALVAALERTGAPSHVLFANSTHRSRSSAYGESKRASAEILYRWGARTGAQVTDLVFPNLFGEHGRPNYNSAVATFCYELSNRAASTVNPDGVTELMHVQDAAQVIIENLHCETDDAVVVEGIKVTIPELYDTLSRLNRAYGGAWFPRLDSRLDLQLFNTLRSYCFPDHYPMPLEIHADERGAFYEVARGYGETQISFSTTEPEITRGNHFHLDKIERFVVLSGRALIHVRRLFQDRLHVFKVDGGQPVAIDMPTLHAHSITNIGEGKLLTAFWANDHFDSAKPDTFVEPALLEGRMS